MMPNYNSDKVVDANTNVQVFLRIRPFLCEELENGQSEDFLHVQDEKTLMVTEKTESTKTDASLCKNLKSYRFHFTQIFDNETSQKDFFYSSMKNTLESYVKGETGVILSCGSRNSGKTYTVQVGDRNNPGLMSRILDTLFNTIGDHLMTEIKLKPVEFCKIQELTKAEQELEIAFKEKLLNFSKVSTSSKEDVQFHSPNESEENLFEDVNASFEKAFINVVSRYKESLKLDIELTESVFSLWISFVELYNEHVFDLLEPFPFKKAGTRKKLHLVQDENGNVYIDGVNKICVSTADEAIRLLLIGQKNLRKAVNEMNCNYNGGHYLFCIESIHSSEDGSPDSAVVNRLLLCDLARIEPFDFSINNPCSDSAYINLSFLTLSRCLNTLKENAILKKQNKKLKHIPFKDCKLTKLFAKAFSDNGHITMVVTASPSSDTCDETIQLLKFSALHVEIINDLDSSEQMEKNAIWSSLTETKDIIRNISLGSEVQNVAADIAALQTDSEHTYNHLDSVFAILRTKLNQMENEKQLHETEVQNKICQEITSIIMETNDCLRKSFHLPEKDDGNAVIKNVAESNSNKDNLGSSHNEKQTDLTIENKLLNAEVHSLKEHLHSLSRSLAKCHLEKAQLQQELKECSKLNEDPLKIVEMQKVNKALTTALVHSNMQLQQMQEQIFCLEKEVSLRQILIEDREKELGISKLLKIKNIEEKINDEEHHSTASQVSNIESKTNLDQKLTHNMSTAIPEDSTVSQNISDFAKQMKDEVEKEKCCRNDEVCIKEKNDLLANMIKYNLTVECERLEIPNFKTSIKLDAFPYLLNRKNRTSRVQILEHPEPSKKPKCMESSDSSMLDINLPEGWLLKTISRKTGLSRGREDIYLFSPKGKKFRSFKELKDYMSSMKPPE